MRQHCQSWCARGRVWPGFWLSEGRRGPGRETGLMALIKHCNGVGGGGALTEEWWTTPSVATPLPQSKPAWCWGDIEENGYPEMAVYPGPLQWHYSEVWSKREPEKLTLQWHYSGLWSKRETEKTGLNHLEYSRRVISTLCPSMQTDYGLYYGFHSALFMSRYYVTKHNVYGHGCEYLSVSLCVNESVCVSEREREQVSVCVWVSVWVC